MATILLTWNPDSMQNSPTKWNWDEMAARVVQVHTEGGFRNNWRCHAHARVGDRVFLLKQGSEPRGIFGRGEVVDEWYREPAKKAKGRGTARAPVLISEMVMPADGSILDPSRLQDILTDREWNIAFSGLPIPDSMSVLLNDAWSEVVRKREHVDANCEGHDVRILAKRRLDHERFSYKVKRNYRHRCAACGLSSRDFLIAAHIVPWAQDQTIRLDPSNGICLCTKHDRAFELGYFHLDEHYRIVLTAGVQNSAELQAYLDLQAGRTITMPVESVPRPEFLTRHRHGSLGRWR